MLTDTTMSLSIGDIYQVDCPACGAQIYDLWDLGFPLTVGQEFPAPCCGEWLRVKAHNGAVIEVAEV